MKSNFKILGVRTYLPKNLSNEEIERVKKIQKRFFDNIEWQYFYSGVKYNDNLINVSNTINDSDVLFDSNNISISVSSIVGKNGTGKSTILDLIIRIINNIGAAIIGEHYVYSSAEHLHYIDYLYADLMILMGNKIKVIKSRGRSLNINIYKQNGMSNNKFIYEKDSDIPLITQNDIDMNKPLDPKQNLRKELSELFYTCIYNYSIYAYNYRDYYSEKTDDKRLSLIRKERKVNVKQPAISQDDFWLMGLFHKNDGYQTPIVLNPMRDDGILNGAEENERAKDRLLSMIFYQDNNGKFPFRDINKNLKMVGLFLPFRDTNWNKNFIVSNLNIGQKTNLYAKLENVCKDIKEYYIDKTGKSNRNDKAYDYLVYKTIKIFRNYKIYSGAKRFLDLKDYNYEKLKFYLDSLIRDESHITVKLRRTINYLLSDMYENPQGGIVNFTVVDKKTDEALIRLRKIFPKTTKSDLVPPPIFETAFRLVKKEDIRNDGEYDDRDIIPFEGLSSGERQLTYTISNFVYHLVNVNSVWDRGVVPDKEVEPDIQYRYINAIFDEVELYYHPDLQRCFLSYLIHALKNISLNHIEGINILIVTHSPFIISDIPSSNIMPLKLPEDSKDELGETFCSNIYDMLNKSFFMQYTVGQLAQEKISELFKLIEKNKKLTNVILDKQKLEMYWYLVDHIGDEYIQKRARQALQSISPLYERGKIEKRIDEINSEKKRLEEELNNLKDNEKD